MTILCTHPDLIASWKKLLEQVGLNMIEKYDKRSWQGIIGLRSSNKDSLIKFSEMGGFLFDMKINKSPPTALISNNSFSKQVILNSITEILKTQPISFHFTSRKQAEEFRQKFIREIYVKTRAKY